MILDTKAAKIVLWSAAIFLSMLAVLVAATGWDGSSDTSADEDIVAEVTSIIPVETATPQTAVINPNPTGDISADEPEIRLPDITTETSDLDQTIIQDGVAIIPSAFEVSPGEEFSLSVEVLIQDSGISGSQISLNFDPEILQITRIATEGVMGSNPLVGMEDIDYGKGLLRYAIARRGLTEVTSEPETIAKITFRVADSALGGVFNLTLPEVNLTGSDFKPVTGFEIQGASLTVTG